MSVKKNTLSAQIWRRFRRNKAAMAGMIVMILIILLSIASGFIYDFNEDVAKQNFAERLQGPSAEHPFGTDDYGRDILTRVIYGSRYSLSIGFAAVAFAVIAGVVFGAIAGFYPGPAETLIMRMTDGFMAIPQMLMALLLVAAFGSSPAVIAFALGLAAVPTYIRVTRGAVLTVRQQEYIESARAIGSSNAKIIIRHIIPNCFAQILVQIPLSIAKTILSVSGLSYIGMGIQAPIPEWGSMLAASRQYLKGYSYIAIFPGLAIVVVILALNLMGDGLRDAADPKLK